jgi:hypothetical protein
VPDRPLELEPDEFDVDELEDPVDESSPVVFEVSEDVDDPLDVEPVSVELD